MFFLQKKKKFVPFLVPWSPSCPLKLIYRWFWLALAVFCCLVFLVHLTGRSVRPKFYRDAKLSSPCKSITIDLSEHVAIFPTNDLTFSLRHMGPAFEVLHWLTMSILQMGFLSIWFLPVGKSFQHWKLNMFGIKFNLWWKETGCVWIGGRPVSSDIDKNLIP